MEETGWERGAYRDRAKEQEEWEKQEKSDKQEEREKQERERQHEENEEIKEMGALKLSEEIGKAQNTAFDHHRGD